MKIYGDLKSGNCLKVKWTADHLGLRYAWTPVDIMQGESRTPAYLAKFPQGQVPAVELEDGRTLAQSNAIICYLAQVAARGQTRPAGARGQTHGSDPEVSARGPSLLPDDAFTQAKIDEWLFWEQYSHEPYIAVCRFHMLYQGKPKEQREAWRVERGEKALDFMEAHLAAGRGQTPGLGAAVDPQSSGQGSDPMMAQGSDPMAPRFLVGKSLTIADISLLAYTRVAHEGGFDLAARPALRAWIEQCERELKL